MTEPVVLPADPTPDPDAVLRSEFDRILALRKMSDQERCQLCLDELNVIYRRWQCVPVVESKIENNIVVVFPGIRAVQLESRN